MSEFYDAADEQSLKELLSKILKEHRKDLLIATKFGNVRDPNGAFFRRK
ncbi:8907_t:CDS:2 [Ambispora leptoticha]|uniref:8907_t:CDS:1 n=1 Tax=Ambispora leptoticha TaxID=144679 RepID=A0A9N8WM61_9GLOM|nr:8907_t:CDS:2 [Ambispora leptoticha]